MKDGIIFVLIVLLGILALGDDGRGEALVQDTTLEHRTSAELVVHACPVKPTPPVAPHVPLSVGRGIV